MCSLGYTYIARWYKVMELDNYVDGYELSFYGLGVLMEIDICWHVHVWKPYDLILATLFDYWNIDFY